MQTIKNPQSSGELPRGTSRRRQRPHRRGVMFNYNRPTLTCQEDFPETVCQQCGNDTYDQHGNCPSCYHYDGGVTTLWMQNNGLACVLAIEIGAGK